MSQFRHQIQLPRKKRANYSEEMLDKVKQLKSKLNEQQDINLRLKTKNSQQESKLKEQNKQIDQLIKQTYLGGKTADLEVQIQNSPPAKVRENSIE